LVKPGEGCDVYIINTCLVTAESARKSRQAIRRARRLEPGAKIAVCGCFSQLEPDEALKLGADLVSGTGDKADFALKAEALVERGDVRQGDGSTVLLPGAVAGRTRALLKIQDGCDNFCSYCIVPYARGRSRSLPLETVAGHARLLESKGFREIVITGIEISSYGKDIESNATLADAVHIIGGAAPGARLRLGSLDPGAVTGSFCAQLQTIGNLCGHFHLALQSGCDETLLRMGRKYDTGTVRSVISRLRDSFPGCGITADLITGFPGETDGEFETTLAFIKEAAFSGMHVFPYSQRPGTPAAALPGQISRIVRQGRASVAAAVAKKMADEFRLGQVGKIRGVLFERKTGGYWDGLTDNYIRIAVKNGGARNTVLPVRITGADGSLVWGEVD